MKERMVLFCVLLLTGFASADDSLDVRLVGACELPLTLHSTGVAVSADYAYLTCWSEDSTDGLYVISVADPTRPVRVGYCFTPGQAQGAAVVGDYAYVADDKSGLRVISVADPAHPVEVGYCDTIGRAMAVTVDGDYAYVASSYPGVGLWVISIADPTHPVVVAHCDTTGGAGGVGLRETLAYVGAARFSVISVADPAHPVVVGVMQGPAGGPVALSGYYAYAGARIIRVADPAHPIDVGATGAGVKGVEVAGDHAYAAAGAYGMEVFSLADPGNPLLIGYYRGRYYDAEAVALAGAYVYVANDYHGLQILQYYGAGVEETPNAEVRTTNSGPTIARGVIRMGDRGQKTGDRTELLDGSGRKVLDLRPGANDVSRLAPGVYFIREAQAQAQAQTLTKVLVTR